MSERIVGVGGVQPTRPITDFMMSWQVAGGYAGPPAASYYVDANVSATGAGSASNPFKTLTEAITASNASIGSDANRWWARRNQIFVCGDYCLNEDLTILPEKCDVIGVGYDIYPFPRIIGNHNIAATRPGLGKANGCRFINMGFVDETGTTDVFATPASCHGLSFLGCSFFPKSGGSTAKALEITNSAGVRIIDCLFTLTAGAAANIFAEAISIEGTASIHDLEISGNRIYATQGIAIANGNTYGSWITDNYIYASAITIKDSSAHCLIVNNRLISAANSTITGAGVITSADGMGAGNKLTCGDDHNAEYPLEDILDG